MSRSARLVGLPPRGRGTSPDFPALHRTVVTVRARIPLVVALLVGVVVAALAFHVTKPGVPEFVAEARMVVLPANADPTYEAVYFDTLSQGQVVLTMAEVIRSTPSDALGTTVSVRAIPDTSVIVVAAEGIDPAAAEAAVKARVSAGLGAISVLALPFRPTQLSDGTGTATAVVTSPLSRYAMVAGAGAIAGAVTWWLLVALLRRRDRDA